MELLLVLLLAGCLVVPLIFITGYIILKILVWTVVIVIMFAMFASWIAPLILFCLLIYMVYKLVFAEA